MGHFKRRNSLNPPIQVQYKMLVAHVKSHIYSNNFEKIELFWQDLLIAALDNFKVGPFPKGKPQLLDQYWSQKLDVSYQSFILHKSPKFLRISTFLERSAIHETSKLDHF